MLTSNPLESRIVRVLNGDGSQDRLVTVFCPFRARSKTIEECMTCERCAGLTFDPNNGKARVLCKGFPDKEEPVSTVPADAGTGNGAVTGLAPVTAVMETEIVCVRPDLSVEALTTLLLERNISGVPVVDDDGKPIGVVSKTDLLRANFEAAGTEEMMRPRSLRKSGDASGLGLGFHECQVARATVNDIMTPLVFALPETATLAQAAALMAYEGVHRVLVVSANGQIVGLLSSLDVLRWIGAQSGYLPPQRAKAK